MVFFAAALISAQSVLGGLVGREVHGVRGSCNTVSATLPRASAWWTNLRPSQHSTIPSIAL
jgi:hypothetical protein